ncbi:hypothetical protein TNCV_4695901 [Trichonephila clavipes]|nr:hypothetical protein TNCV_4695901 [Trichonephila clavipes]
MNYTFSERAQATPDSSELHYVRTITFLRPPRPPPPLGCFRAANENTFRKRNLFKRYRTQLNNVHNQKSEKKGKKRDNKGLVEAIPHYTAENIRHVYYSRTTIRALLMASDLIASSGKARLAHGWMKNSQKKKEDSRGAGAGRG